jgi:DNA-directed RNA polymerase subunit RPC12/RpoP
MIQTYKCPICRRTLSPAPRGDLTYPRKYICEYCGRVWEIRLCTRQGTQ